MYLEKDQKGDINILMVMVVFFTLTTLVLAGLSIYYIRQYQTAKTTVDMQRAEAAEQARVEQKAADEADFAERIKEPYRSYSAPVVLGALQLSFPKSWNIYAEEDQDSGTQLNLYLTPDVVRADNNYNGAYALRLTLQRKLYTEIVEGLQEDIEEGLLRASPITVKGIEGTSYAGQVIEDRTGFMVVLPIRDKTLSIWTESTDYQKDFDKIISKLQVSP